MNLYLLSPEIALATLALVVLLVDLITKNHRVVAYLSLAGLTVPAALSLSLLSVRDTSFHGALVIDPFAIFFKLLFLATTALVILSAVHYVDRYLTWRGEFYPILLVATIGMMMMASSGELITIYIALETASISLYVLVGLRKRDLASGEAAIKYLLLGAMATAILLYGMALLYGISSTTNLAGIALALSAAPTQPVALLAMVLVVCGLGFKIAAVPFQMWAPDVYQGAPTPVTSFLSVASKAAGFAVLLRLLSSALAPLYLDWQAIFVALAVVTMTVGNLAALAQNNIKRLMAYSSIAAAGYLLVGLAAAAAGAPGVLVFLLAYAFTNLGAFAAIIAFSNQAGSDEIEDYSGLASRAPLLALGFAICLLSLIGIPPLAGFWGKFYVFAAAFSQGLQWLVVVALLNSAISMYYYLRVVKFMYLGAPRETASLPVPGALALTVGFTSLAVIAIGIAIGPLMGAAQVAASGLVP